VCDAADAHFMDWHGVCGGGLCSGGLSAGQTCAEDADCVELIHVYHEGIVPTGVYEIQAVDQTCPVGEEASYSPPLTIPISIWGDVVEDCLGDSCGPPAGVVNITTDVTAVLDKFRNWPPSRIKPRCDVHPGRLDHVITITDVSLVLDAFLGFEYPFEPTADPCVP
jgi:hypothetical protein